MSNEECKHFYIIPVLIVFAYSTILYLSHYEMRNLAPTGPILPLAPVSLALLMPAIITINDTIKLLGGVRKYFCGGAKALANMIERGIECRGDEDGSRRIITWGPFEYARHPVYTSTILITISLTIICPSLILALPLVTVWVYTASIVEEKELLCLEEYSEYMSRVPRIHITGVVRYGYSRIYEKLSR